MLQFLFLVLIPTLIFTTNAKICNNSLINLKPEPIALTSSRLQFIYPKTNRKIITTNSGEIITFSCSQSTFAHSQLKAQSTIDAKCISNQLYEVKKGKTIDFNALTCSEDVKSNARYTGNSCASALGDEFEVGFVVNTQFVRLISGCYETGANFPFFVKYTITKKIAFQETILLADEFIDSQIFGMPTHLLYTKESQQRTINQLVNLPPNSTKYISLDVNLSNYWAQGQLAAKTDFVYEPQQRATFEFANSVPQWQALKTGNWQKMEANLRDYASAEEVDLEVYSGTYGVATLPHEMSKDDQVQIYLYADSNGRRSIPIPKLIWKVVYNRKTLEGLAVVGVNNPFVVNMRKELICEDVADEYDWFTWNRKRKDLGFVYVCDVNEFRRNVDYLPEFKVFDRLY